MLKLLVKCPHSLLVVALIIMIITVSCTGCGYRESTQDVWGRTEAKEVDINSKIPGRVTELLVREGDHVQKGQLLARIDGRDIIAQVKQAEAGAQSTVAQLSLAETTTTLQNQTTQASLENAKAQLAKAQADLSLAENDYHRFAELVESGTISKQTFDSYKSKYEVTLTALTQAQASVSSAEASLLQNKINQDNEAALRSKVIQAKAQVEQIQVSLDETEIRAPFDGIITTKYIEQGAMISTGVPIVTIQDPLDNWVNIKVKETDLGKYQIGKLVRLEGRDGKLHVQGTIVDISQKAEYATYRATSERGEQDIITFNVKIQVNSEQLRPGMRFLLLTDRS